MVRITTVSRDGYETELTGSREEVAAALSGVVDGLLAGSIRLGEGDDAVAVDVPSDLALEIELETENDKVSLELELEWDAPTEGEAVSSAAEPVPSVPAAGPDWDEVARVDTDDEVAEVDTDDESVETLPIPVGADDGSASLARFELFRDRADEWRWRLRHRNGNVIATSGEGYTRKHNARKGLRSVMRNAGGASVGESEG